MEVEDQEPPTIPDMDEAQDIFLLELHQSTPDAVPDYEAVKKKVLEKVLKRVQVKC